MHVADLSVLLRLIELSALVEVDGRAFDGLLAVACLHRPREVVEALRDSGIAEWANVDQVGPSPEALTPLLAALRRDETDEKRAILNYPSRKLTQTRIVRGAIIGAPLHLACLKSTPETIEMLIRYGAALDSTDHGGAHTILLRLLSHPRACQTAACRT